MVETDTHPTADPRLTHPIQHVASPRNYIGTQPTTLCDAALMSAGMCAHVGTAGAAFDFDRITYLNEQPANCQPIRVQEHGKHANLQLIYAN